MLLCVYHIFLVIIFGASIATLCSIDISTEGFFFKKTLRQSFEHIKEDGL